MVEANPLLLNEYLTNVAYSGKTDYWVKMKALKVHLKAITDPEFERQLDKVDDVGAMRYLMAAGMSASRLIILTRRLEELGE